MTKAQVMKAWAKSANKSLTTHREFEERMVQKTIINSVCNMLVNSHPENSSFADNSDDPNAPETEPEYADAEEIVEVHELPDAPQYVDTETGEIKDEPTQEAPVHAHEHDDDSDF